MVSTYPRHPQPLLRIQEDSFPQPSLAVPFQLQTTTNDLADGNHHKRSPRQVPSEGRGTDRFLYPTIPVHCKATDQPLPRCILNRIPANAYLWKKCMAKSKMAPGTTTPFTSMFCQMGTRQIQHHHQQTPNTCRHTYWFIHVPRARTNDKQSRILNEFQTSRRHLQLSAGSFRHVLVSHQRVGPRGTVAIIEIHLHTLHTHHPAHNQIPSTATRRRHHAPVRQN